MLILKYLREGLGTPMGWIEAATLLIEFLAIVIIVGYVLYSTTRFVYTLITKKLSTEDNYRNYKHGLGRSLILGLEILVAADVVRTVALEPTLENIAALGLLVIVRTFLSWSLVVEIEGRWPWQPKKAIPE